MTCEEIQHGLYVFGTLEAEERAELEAHLARGCPTCTAAVAQARGLAAHLALAAPQTEPPASLRQAILRAAAPTAAAARPEPRPSPFWKWAFALSAVAVMALLMISVSFYQQMRSLESELRTALIAATSTRGHQRELQKRLGAYREALRLMAAPEVREVRIGPKQPTGRLFLQPRGLVMIASDFPQPPPGRTFELWLIAANRPDPIPAGVFDPDASGNALHIWQQPIEIASIKAIAVSDEPPGGVPAPTGKILFSAPVQ